MGCGSSGNVVPAHEGSNGHHKAANGTGHHDDDLPTVVLPDTPAKAKPPSPIPETFQGLTNTVSLMAMTCRGAIAFEIPLDEFDSNRRMSATPPPHLQRLLQPTQTEISLPDIEEKLAEAEQRRQSILQQRAQSAQKRAQKMMRSFHEMDRLDSEHEPMNMDATKPDSVKTDPYKGPMNMDSMKTDSMTMNPMKMDSMEMTPGRVEHIDTPRTVEHIDSGKHGTNAVHITPEPGTCEDKNIT